MELLDYLSNVAWTWLVFSFAHFLSMQVVITMDDVDARQQKRLLLL
jgi:hypothetical protein